MLKPVLIFSLLISTSLLTGCGAPGDENVNGSSATMTDKSKSSQGFSSTTQTSKSSTAQQTSSRSSARSSLRSSLTSSSVAQTKPVTIQWSHPIERENGSYLELNEIGGYEIRVVNRQTSAYTSHLIAGNSTTQYTLNNYQTTMSIEIAVYDTQGLYSEFVPVTN
jgi:uncharacterized protein YcfL